MRGIPKVPYFQTSRYRVETMVELADQKPGDRGADLGSGDGRIVIAFAKRGIEIHGYEIDETLIKNSEEKISELNLKNAFINNKDFWSVNLSEYNFICCYPMPTIMGRLERKLQDELKPGTKVLLNYFPFKHWKLKTMKDNVYLYIK